jgi:hypothetical protein
VLLLALAGAGDNARKGQGKSLTKFVFQAYMARSETIILDHNIPPHPPENPCLSPPPKKKINYGMRVLECLQGRTQDFFTRGH